MLMKHKPCLESFGVKGWSKKSAICCHLKVLAQRNAHILLVKTNFILLWSLYCRVSNLVRRRSSILCTVLLNTVDVSRQVTTQPMSRFEQTLARWTTSSTSTMWHWKNISTHMLKLLSKGICRTQRQQMVWTQTVWYRLGVGIISVIHVSMKWQRLLWRELRPICSSMREFID